MSRSCVSRLLVVPVNLGQVAILVNTLITHVVPKVDEQEVRRVCAVKRKKRCGTEKGGF